MRARKGFVRAVIRLAGKRYHAVIEIKEEGHEIREIVNDWKALHARQERPGNPFPVEIEHWQHFDAKPDGLPERPLCPGSGVAMWQSVPLSASGGED